MTSTMSTILQHRMTPAFGLVLFALLLLPAPGLQAQEEAAAPQTSLEAFEALYAEVGTAEAEEIAFELKTELIRGDAEIEVLKLEAARFDGKHQMQTLDRLVAAAAARERRIIGHTRRLEALSGASAPCVEAVGAPAASVPGAGAVAGETAETAATEPKGGKNGTFQITFEPEDLVDNPDS